MIFNAYEAFEMAEQIERNGLAFYNEAASKVDEPRAKALLQSLAVMESQHEKYFAMLKEDYKLVPESELPDLDMQYVQYLHSLVKGRIFNENGAAKLEEGGATLEGILQTALSFERSTVVYFVSVKEAVPESLGRDRIDSIIKEEIRHIALLSERLDAVVTAANPAK